jgi:hypothetical protein
MAQDQHDPAVWFEAQLAASRPGETRSVDTIYQEMRAHDDATTQMHHDLIVEGLAAFCQATAAIDGNPLSPMVMELNAAMIVTLHGMLHQWHEHYMTTPEGAWLKALDDEVRASMAEQHEMPQPGPEAN